MCRVPAVLARAYAFSTDPLPADFPLPTHDVGFGHLAISPGYGWVRIVVNGRHVILIGHCVDLDNPSLDESAIARKLVEAASVPEATFRLLGRFVVIDHRDGRTRVCGDATSMRTIYYAEDVPVVASHSTLIGGVIGETPRTEPFRYYRFGLPGNLSITPRVRVLPANFSLDLAERRPQRFWPGSTDQRHERSVDEAYPLVERLLLDSAAALTTKAQCVVSLTAGIDSRVTLAALRAHPETRTFTYDRGLEDASDLRTAQLLAKRVGLSHETLRMRRADDRPESSAATVAMVDYKHDVRLPALYARAFGGSDVLHVRSNLLEIGRAFWRKKLGDQPSLDGANWRQANLYNPATMPGYDEALATFEAEMPSFFDLMGYDLSDPSAPALHGYDAWDLFYWEHRMPTWHSQLVLGTDPVFETSVLFNSRAFLAALLDVPLADRKAATLMHRFIAAHAPEIVGIPVNPGPTKWEQMQRNAQKARGRLQRTLRR